MTLHKTTKCWIKQFCFRLNTKIIYQPSGENDFIAPKKYSICDDWYFSPFGGSGNEN